MNTYRDRHVWQISMDLVTDVYKATAKLPDSERFGLVSQMRRAAVSIPSNIAEDHARPAKEYVRFLSISRGSLQELETQIEIATRLNFWLSDESVVLFETATRTGRLLNSLIRSLRNRSRTPIPNRRIAESLIPDPRTPNPDP